MIKKVIVLAFCVGIIAGVLFFLLTNQKDLQPSPTPSKTVTQATPTAKPYVEKSSIFVPYWELSSNPDYSAYTDIYYFGISPNINGVNTSDQGYLSLNKFVKNAEGKNTYLVLRMTDTDQNSDILRSKNAQTLIIKETLETAKENGFKGVVLDLELGVLPFSRIVNDINTFEANFFLSAHNNHLQFMQTMYGDVFYRKRPFDVQYLAQNSDGILVMAYDFHKANGDPGPNFPLAGKKKFGYDFQQMITDFQSVVPSDKLTVVFGMFGYDWTTDLAGRALESGKSITENEITADYIYKCNWKNCVFRRDPDAAEVQINYVDSTSNPNYLIYHTLWYEDQKSVDQKKAFLKSKGIGSTAYWAFGYF